MERQKSPVCSFLAPAAVIVGIVASAAAHAAGFDDKFKVYSGDFNADGRTDLYVKRTSGATVIPLDDIPIVIPAPVGNFVLQADSQHGFAIVSSLTAAQIAAMAQWPEATAIDLDLRDVDLSGSIDLELTGINQVIPDAFEQIVFSADRGGRAPLGLTSKNIKFQRYHAQVFGWLQDHNFFQNNAPLKITSAEPAQRSWSGSVRDPSNFFLINEFLAGCQAQNPNSTCAVSDRPPPPPCERTSALYDDNGQYVGQGTTNICEISVHVIIYTPGSITVAPDYSAFDVDARETTEILDNLNETCPVFPSGDAGRLADIQEMMYQGIFMRGVARADHLNSFSHEPFPGDDIFNTLDLTFHHYDIRTKVCNLGEQGCTLATVHDNAARFYTFPTRQLRPLFTQIPGPAQMAYITAPGFTSVSSAYIIKAGRITQRYVTSGRWVGAIQNVTQADHVVYPGLISHYIDDSNNALTVFTHGTGINRGGCTLNTPSRPLNVLLSAANDAEGPKAFRQLDKEMIRYWKRNYGPSGSPTPPPPAGPGNPANMPSPNQ